MFFKPVVQTVEILERFRSWLDDAEAITTVLGRADWRTREIRWGHGEYNQVGLSVHVDDGLLMLVSSKDNTPNTLWLYYYLGVADLTADTEPPVEVMALLTLEQMSQRAMRGVVFPMHGPDSVGFYYAVPLSAKHWRSKRAFITLLTELNAEIKGPLTGVAKDVIQEVQEEMSRIEAYNSEFMVEEETQE